MYLVLGCLLFLFTEKWLNTDYKNCHVTPCCNACVRWLIPFFHQNGAGAQGRLSELYHIFTDMTLMLKHKSFFRQADFFFFGISKSNPFSVNRKKMHESLFYKTNPNIFFFKCVSVHWISNHCALFVIGHYRFWKLYMHECVKHASWLQHRGEM